MEEYALNDIVEMKKPHPCGVNRWQIIRVGADIKIECTGCGHIVMMSRYNFNKRLKKVLERAEQEEN
ncbi:DUF951 domain-containing protein [Limosilactobacillus fermentum]|uniref:DUF951 domain-containing protein n=1 Tax=Limosilactobacillus fermentum TaxID=1613 RepID=UPI00032A5F4D|nr:DUF951 domain-containing protein [Limosilactobacillus fermentum]AGL88002.1 hypothetical protein LBFF_0080 [Limosilactobacillus fermentum F-6]MCH5383982.1 DUF951 domain-containing protein [Limosilactobacillus fermentum]QEY00104.1 DUF951 domain-containing protein [Limosilactobacillus fermentum]QEY00158.1 DUF951 domain-containing protein [Limosilactobacillus fermentum]QWQ33716.1 DUF951 domain-containing protein [Limosilactobacillus fermentum]